MDKWLYWEFVDSLHECVPLFEDENKFEIGLLMFNELFNTKVSFKDYSIFDISLRYFIDSIEEYIESIGETEEIDEESEIEHIFDYTDVMSAEIISEFENTFGVACLRADIDKDYYTFAFDGYIACLNLLLSQITNEYLLEHCEEFLDKETIEELTEFEIDEILEYREESLKGFKKVKKLIRNQV